MQPMLDGKARESLVVALIIRLGSLVELQTNSVVLGPQCNHLPHFVGSLQLFVSMISSTNKITAQKPTAHLSMDGTDFGKSGEVKCRES